LAALFIAPLSSKPTLSMKRIKPIKSIQPFNQLTLGVSLKDRLDFSNFFTGNNIYNTQLVNTLKKTSEGNAINPDQSYEQIIYFYGVRSQGGQGCTHLLQACCHQAHEAQQTVVYIPLSNMSEFSPAIFDNLEKLDLICIDDIQELAGKPAWEEALFHLYNRTQGRLIIAAKAAPKALNFILPDMISRLVSSIVFQLQPLSDSEKLEALIMRAARRGMTLTLDTGKFILTHYSRDTAVLFSALDTLDKMSLAAQRKLTIPFIKTILAI
jgi:DnaA family protein